MTDPHDRTPTLCDEPKDFFMTLRDIAFWVRSARADAALARLRGSEGSAAAFDQLYAARSDPFASVSPQFRYQRRKYHALLSMLPKRSYRRALDVGCGLGVLTRLLAGHADHVLGIDLSAVAAEQARLLSADQPNIEFAQGDITAWRDDGTRFDLIILADVVYYLSPLDDSVVESLASRIAGMLAPDGLLLLVNHFFFTIDPASRMTRKIHDSFRSSPNLTSVAEHRRAFYLATLLQRGHCGGDR